VKKSSLAREETQVTIRLQEQDEDVQQPGPACNWPAAKTGQKGALCSRCRQGVMDYDGLLNLVCPQCGNTEGGCFT
jgi:hypothetical protein